MQGAGVVLVAAALTLSAVGCSTSASSVSPDPGTPPSTSTPPSTTTYTKIDLVVGTGAAANVGSRITISYGAWLFDGRQTDSKGRQFDLNNSFTFTLGMGQVIKGEDQGIVGMRVGGQRRLIIPPDLGFGNQAVGPVPANSTLVYDIRLVSVS